MYQSDKWPLSKHKIYDVFGQIRCLFDNSFSSMAEIRYILEVIFFFRMGYANGEDYGINALGKF